MGNKQNKPTPTPMLKVESKSFSYSDEKERPRKGIPRRIGNVLLTRWIELKRREKMILEKARAAVSEGHAPPAILEEFTEQVKEETKTHRIKYHPRVLANILVRKAPKPRIRNGLRVPKLTATAARRIHQSFLRRDLERQQEQEKDKIENNRTRSRISLRQQAWTDTMPRKMVSGTNRSSLVSGTTRSTQTISQPLPISRDISLRSFRTGESGIGMSRASSMTSIASTKPKLMYTRERGKSVSDRVQSDEKREDREESRRKRILKQRKKIRKQDGDEEGHEGEAENATVRRKDLPSEKKEESQQKQGHGGELLHRRRRSSQQHLPDSAESHRQENLDLHQIEDGQLVRRQSSRRQSSKRTSIKKVKKITYHEYWRRRALLSRALKKKENGSDSGNFRAPKGTINKLESETVEKTRQPPGKKTCKQTEVLEKEEESGLNREMTEMMASSQRPDTLKRRDSESSTQRLPYSFSRNSRRFDEVADELMNSGRLSHNSHRSNRNSFTRRSSLTKPQTNNHLPLESGEEDSTGSVQRQDEEQQNYHGNRLEGLEPGFSGKSRRGSTHILPQTHEHENNVEIHEENRRTRRRSSTQSTNYESLPPDESPNAEKTVGRFRKTVQQTLKQDHAIQTDESRDKEKLYAHLGHAIKNPTGQMIPIKQNLDRSGQHEEQVHGYREEPYDHENSQEYAGQYRSHEHPTELSANQHSHSDKHQPSRKEQKLQLARVVPIVEQGRMIESRGSRNAQLVARPREEHLAPVGRPSVSQSQGHGDAYYVENNDPRVEGRAVRCIPVDYGYNEQTHEYSLGGRTGSYKNEVVYVDRGPVTVYEGRLLQPLHRGTTEMREASGSRRWRKVSVVDVWELGEWERLRRSEEALARSRSSATTIPRAL